MSEKSAAIRVLKESSRVVSAVTAAAGFVRSIALKPFTPALRSRELLALQQQPDAYRSRCQLFREKGNGSVPTIVLGGFVPDATETVEFQRDLLRQHGSLYYLNYSRNGFCQTMFAAQLADLIDELSRKGQKPLIMAVSFGCGLLTHFLRQAEAAIHENIRGLIMVSPVITTADLIRPPEEKRDGVRILESNLKKIVAADPANAADIDKQIERSRRCFQALFNAGAENRTLRLRHLAIRKKINEVIEQTTSRGGFERVMALRNFTFPPPTHSVFAGPTLTLLAENEGDILVPTSPTLQLFGAAQLFQRLFPVCSVKTVRSGNSADGVAHASLIFHHDAYNALLESWYERLLYPGLKLAV